ncbi:NAD-dependent epimerase/dehydratase family protein [Clostridium chromiireducens]|uniref:dTDP-glucose 4,6-dehydratase n=1 Tax=Clostridium chromiireducens TaxID=225345 RepID=A0A1V4IWU3_9CLOT|nr:NAD-dependent epimerase/dehydratase family protein [Clostridium chromiireducens]OPJ64518.1 dTDP-glucose 4,6-dehydratase [Clostridium chromiireducens]
MNLVNDEMNKIKKYVNEIDNLFDDLRGSTILITGSTGLIGSQLVKFLAAVNRINNLKIKIIALARNASKVSKVFGDLAKYPELEIIYGDILNDIQYEKQIDYIIHSASITASKDFVEYPVETIHTALSGTENMLKLAKDKKVKSIIYISSLEIYGITKEIDIKENEYGYIEHLNVRSSYSEGKRMAECLCCSYYKEYKVPVKIIRLTQSFGSGVMYDDNRVFAQFARGIIENKNIVLYTRGETMRSYLHTIDAAYAIITVLLKGKNGEAYNAANQDTMISIANMAQRLVENYPQSKSQVVFEVDKNIEKRGFNPVVKINLNTEKINELGWTPKFSLEDMYEDMIESMKISQKGEGIV